MLSSSRFGRQPDFNQTKGIKNYGKEQGNLNLRANLKRRVFRSLGTDSSMRMQDVDGLKKR